VSAKYVLRPAVAIRLRSTRRGDVLTQKTQLKWEVGSGEGEVGCGEWEVSATKVTFAAGCRPPSRVQEFLFLFLFLFRASRIGSAWGHQFELSSSLTAVTLKRIELAL
jgi:hypothetical protein